MPCLIHHIREDFFNNLNLNHRKQVNIFIMTRCPVLYEEELHGTPDTFWSKLTNFNHNIDPFESNRFIYISKYTCAGNSHLWHQKYYLPFTKFICFVAFRVTSNFLRMRSVERSIGDVKK